MQRWRSQISCTITTKIPNPSWKLLFPASPGTFRFTRYCQTFFLLQCSQQRTFQICNWVIFRGVMVGYAKLVVTKIMYNHNRKLQIQVGNCCFLLHLVHFVFNASAKHSLYCNDLNNVFFRFFIEAFSVKLQKEMSSWLTRFWHADHDWKLKILFEKGCLHPEAFNLIRRLIVQHSLQSTRLHVGCFRFFIEEFFVKLQKEMRSWLTRFWHADHDWKLVIHFEKGSLHTQLFDFVRRLLMKHSSQLTRLHVGCFRFFIEAFLVKLHNKMRSWLTRFWVPDHDWKLEIRFENCGLHPQVFNLVRRLLVQHSSQFTRLHVGRFRFCIAAFLVKL